AKLRAALVQAAHLIADAMEAEESAPETPKVKPLPKTRARRAGRTPYVPPNRELSELDRARARQAAKKAGIPLP
ncbi:MAG TPA: hypothetical protein VK540_17590, partial [Polyangiaceae bacterium]|nr:hypothetical protein [Polyangiaceae bacterium]